eukprot:5469588-Pleurochrysis_carterae.AAC.1
MRSFTPELLHLGDLNVDKQLHKQGLQRHLNTFALEKVSEFYLGMGAPLNLVGNDGNRSGDKWFKAAQRASM